MHCIINRKAEFSATHKYWLSDLSESDNADIHGHNYVLYVSLFGKIDQYGMLENLSYVKDVLKKEVINQLNYSYLNKIWPEFQQTLPSTENMAKVIWQRLQAHLPLCGVQLYKNPYLWADYRGIDMQASLTIKNHFSAAHRLALPHLSQNENEAIYGKCARVHGHGHNYHLEITVNGEIDPKTGMIVDLLALQKVVNDLVVEPMDHTFLNFDIPHFQITVPTAENIALYIAQQLQSPVTTLGAKLERIKLIESPNNSAEILCNTLSSEFLQAQQKVTVC
jgi:6-pyruvoyltetrahydropterin/6-carboxytetrahydropterin synthase